MTSNLAKIKIAHIPLHCDLQTPRPYRLLSPKPNLIHPPLCHALQKKCLFSRVKTLETSNKNLRKKFFRRSRWPSKAVEGNTVEKSVSTAFLTLEESILSLSRVITLNKKCWITSCVLLVLRVMTLGIIFFIKNFFIAK